MKKESAVERADRLENASVRVWSVLQDADGSRGGLQQALDDAQDIIEEEIPDVEEQAANLETDTEEEDEEEDEEE